MAGYSCSHLSRTLSYILRHGPESFGLQLDPDGSVPVCELVSALRAQKFPELREEDLHRLVAEDERGRFEFLAEKRRIRAMYGHSLAGVHPDYERIIPPETLYHGTARRLITAILREGLRPGERNFVHLSGARREARRVGLRRDSSPVILCIAARRASCEGISFYRAGSGVYLAKYIPPEFIIRREYGRRGQCGRRLRSASSPAGAVRPHGRCRPQPPP